VVAAAAVGARRDDAFVFREACQEDVKEAAEGQAQKSGQDSSGEL